MAEPEQIVVPIQSAVPVDAICGDDETDTKLFREMAAEATRFVCSFECVAMKRQELELVRGSGNIFRDLGRENADVEQLKALLAAEIIKALNRERLTVRSAHARTGVAAADFSRIRNADLARFTADRLMMILNRLGAHVEVKIRVRRVEPVRAEATA